MATVRVWDALRYGSKFVGLFLVVVIVAGGFVAGGAYLAADAISLSDPSLSALSETPVFIGVVLLAIGAILGAVGWATLAYKFLADSLATALDARDVGEAPTAAGPGSADDEAGTETAEPTDDSESEGTETEPATTPDESPTTAAANGSETSSDRSGVDQPGQTPPTTDPTTAEADAGGDTPSEGASTEPAVDQPDAAAADTGDRSPAEDPEPEDPPEWTPPDPSEFESNGSEDAEEPEPRTDQWADETATGEPTNGDPTGNGPVSDETVVEDAGAGQGPATSPDPDDIDEDATLADEGVESFSAASEEDPLSDRLPGNDDS